MVAPSDISGQRFGRLVGARRIGASKNGHAIWLWRCDCGKTKSIFATSVKSGKVKSCGCLQDESRTKHGHSPDGKKSRTYQAWQNMIARVSGKSKDSKKHYVSREIGACRRWRKFKNFLSDMGECPPGLTLERENNDGNYEPGNCRWATQSDQIGNTRRAHRVVWLDKTMCLRHACAESGANYRAALRRVSDGMAAQRALDIGVQR